MSDTVLMRNFFLQRSFSTYPTPFGNIFSKFSRKQLFYDLLLVAISSTFSYFSFSFFRVDNCLLPANTLPFIFTLLHETNHVRRKNFNGSARRTPLLSFRRKNSPISPQSTLARREKECSGMARSTERRKRDDCIRMQCARRATRK